MRPRTDDDHDVIMAVEATENNRLVIPAPYRLSFDEFTGERCTGGGKLMYSVLAVVLGSSRGCG